MSFKVFGLLLISITNLAYAQSHDLPGYINCFKHLGSTDSFNNEIFVLPITESNDVYFATKDRVQKINRNRSEHFVIDYAPLKKILPSGGKDSMLDFRDWKKNQVVEKPKFEKDIYLSLFPVHHYSDLPVTYGVSKKTPQTKEERAKYTRVELLDDLGPSSIKAIQDKIEADILRERFRLTSEPMNPKVEISARFNIDACLKGLNPEFKDRLEKKISESEKKTERDDVQVPKKPLRATRK